MGETRSTSAVLVRAALAGLAAAWVKAVSEPPLQRLAERLLPPSPASKRQVGADPAGHPENLPPAVVIARLAAALGAPVPAAAKRVAAQRVVHYVFGTGLGVGYAMAARHRRESSAGRGTAAGFAVYAGTHGSLLPAAGVQPPPWNLSPAAVGWELASHLLWGAALDAASRATGALR